ncbi:hypothetical protein DM01DRAFT_1157900 [Hesseltinella vesiculosa]|uniref:ATP-dependent DNA helicase n=1 Tax=Hesseltinella vesiculosa TaxID=101127 RepID=A0A1X2GS91_9FUNG|nr:hypothetical protein DM01DRAFT_1157900 [Hesseltinella vesiculosa]
MRNTKQKKGGLYNFFSVAPKPDATAPAKTSSASTAAPCMDLTDDEPLILSSSSSNLIDLTDDDLFIPGRHLPSSSQQSDRMQIDSDPRPVARTVDTPVIEMASSNKYRINSSSQPIRTKPLYSSQEKPRWSPSSISHSQSDSRPRQEIQRRATVKPPPFMPNRDPLVTSGNTLAVEKDIPSSPYTSRASPALSLDDEDLFFTSSKSGFQPASTLSQWEPHPYNPPKTTSKIPTSTPAQRVSYVNPNPYGSSRFGQGTRPLASALGGMSSQSSRGGSSYGSGVSSASSKRKMPASFKSGGSVPKRSSFGKSFGGGHHGRPGRGHQNNKPAEYRPTLSNEQQRVLNMVLNDQQSIFFTGSAGTGKSVLMRALIEALMDKYGPDAVAVTASTGIAACNINGSTLHSFSGIGLGTETVHKLIEKVKYSKRACQRWKRTRVLIIDESKTMSVALWRT